MGDAASRARSPCSRSVAASHDETPTKIIEIPHLLSLLATGSWDGKVTGLNELQSQYKQQYGPGEYIPNVFIQYWSMRTMAYLGSVLPLLALWGLWLWRRRGSRRPECSWGGDVVGAGAVRDEHRRLAAHRERTPAVDRSRSDATQNAGTRRR